MHSHYLMINSHFALTLKCGNALLSMQLRKKASNLHEEFSTPSQMLSLGSTLQSKKESPQALTPSKYGKGKDHAAITIALRGNSVLNIREQKFQKPSGWAGGTP